MVLELPEKDRRWDSAKVPEWAALLTIITILAFSNSFFEVLALGLVLNTQLTSYFSPIDYVAITPVWTGVYLACIILLIAMLIGFTALGSYHEGSSWHFTWVQFCLGGFRLKIPRIKRSNYTVVCGMSVLLAS